MGWNSNAWLKNMFDSGYSQSPIFDINPATGMYKQPLKNGYRPLKNDPSITFKKQLPPPPSPLSTILNFTAVGAATTFLADLVVPSIKSAYEDKMGKVPVVDPVASAPSVDLPPDVLNPYAPNSFVFHEENSPPLLPGIMQSSEVVSKTITEQTKVLANNHAEHMGVLASKMQLDEDFHTALNINLGTLNVILATILQAISESPTPAAIGALGEVIAPISTSIDNKKTTDLEPLTKWAALASERETYNLTPRSFTDSDGSPIYTGIPMDLKSQKDAQHKKYLDDHNTYKVEDDDFSPMSQVNPFISFVGSSPIYDLSTPLPNDNPFIPNGL